jgi:hypothetical protein
MGPVGLGGGRTTGRLTGPRSGMFIERVGGVSIGAGRSTCRKQVKEVVGPQEGGKGKGNTKGNVQVLWFLTSAFTI